MHSRKLPTSYHTRAETALKSLGRAHIDISEDKV